jgi:hypothetical protein
MQITHSIQLVQSGILWRASNVSENFLGQQLPILANEWCANTEINQVEQLLNLRRSVALHIVGVLGLLKHPEVQFCLVLSGAPKCPSLLLLVFGQGI